MHTILHYTNKLELNDTTVFMYFDQINEALVSIRLLKNKSYWSQTYDQQFSLYVYVCMCVCVYTYIHI